MKGRKKNVRPFLLSLCCVSRMRFHLLRFHTFKIRFSTDRSVENLLHRSVLVKFFAKDLVLKVTETQS